MITFLFVNDQVLKKSFILKLSMQSKRLNSRWKYIFINDESKNTTTCFTLNELGKIDKSISQPKRISMIKKYNSINKNIKELVQKGRLYSRNVMLSFSGNIEVFTRDNNYAQYFAMVNPKDNQTEKEKVDINVENDSNGTNNENDSFNLTNFFNLNVEEMQIDDDFDDYFQL